MYCPQCKCEYVGWRRCPDCEVPLVEALPLEHPGEQNPLSYEDLLDHLRANRGQIEIEVTASGVSREKKWRFPYLGYGYAWANGMQGAQDGLHVNLHTSDVGREHGWSFPYFGYGYAWEKAMRGDAGGSPIEIKATKVQRKRHFRFPYLGYGRAWTERLEGACGERINASLEITEVAKSRSWRFPYNGYGFAWPKKGVLTLSLAN